MTDIAVLYRHLGKCQRLRVSESGCVCGWYGLYKYQGIAAFLIRGFDYRHDWRERYAIKICAP